MIRRFARPYARAIMDVTATPQVASALLAELKRFEEMRRGSAELSEVYANPGIEPEAKNGITQAIARRLGLSDLAVKVLDVLIQNHRVNELDAINAALAEYIRQATGVVAAQVRTAHRLSPEEQTKLQQTLQKKTGRPVEIELTTDPTLLGGFIARIGSEIYDASVAGKIEKFRNTLP